MANRKTTGSILFKARIFLDPTLGAVALGGWSTCRHPYAGYLGQSDGDWNLVSVLRHDGTRMPRMFVPHTRRYEVMEIDVGR
jgi:hypothetical protein